MDISEGSPAPEQERGESEQQGEVLVIHFVLSGEGEEEGNLIARALTVLLPRREESQRRNKERSEGSGGRKTSQWRMAAARAAVGTRAALHGETSAGGGNEEEDVSAVPAGSAGVPRLQLQELRRFQWFYQKSESDFVQVKLKFKLLSFLNV